MDSFTFRPWIANNKRGVFNVFWNPYHLSPTTLKKMLKRREKQTMNAIPKKKKTASRNDKKILLVSSLWIHMMKTTGSRLIT